MAELAAILDELDGLQVETRPQRVRRRSRDFYWYSPILKRQLDHVTGDAVVTVRDEAELVRVVRWAYAHDVPLTVRGGGTGNYGQAMPLAGGVVLDLSAMTRVKEIELGKVRVEAGATILDVDRACREASGQELRFHPSTRATGTIGGYVAGGSSGIGSVTWGLLRDPGNILAARVVTMEAEPRVLELAGAEVQKVNHAYGTNGIITELEMPLAPAYPWREIVLAFDDFMAACRFADGIAKMDGLTKKLVCVLPAPIAGRWVMPELAGEGDHLVLLMVADTMAEIFRDHVAATAPGARVLMDVAEAARPEGALPLYEYTWNHTTLHCLKHTRAITYLQTLFPPPDHLAKVEELWRHFGEEVHPHLEFVRFGGEIACFGLQVVAYTSDARLQAIMAEHNARGCPIFNPHDYTLEGGGMKKVDHLQLDFKREADPKGLLNPGKMIGWENPDYDESADRRFLYEH
ncbi:MAG: FAD-binding oxidoreductase [Alphaproteobacteria bacterium]